MEYNSQKEKLVIPEYGRNIQNIIKEGRKIEDKGMRSAYMFKVADLIMQMHPHNKNLDDYVQKIWNHIYLLSEFDLDINLPEGVHLKAPEEFAKKRSLLRLSCKEYQIQTLRG